MSDAIYQILGQVAGRLLVQKLATLTESNNPQEESSTTKDEVEALAAVHRLTTLFAGVKIDRLEMVDAIILSG